MQIVCAPHFNYLVRSSAQIHTTSQFRIGGQDSGKSS